MYPGGSGKEHKQCCDGSRVELRDKAAQQVAKFGSKFGFIRAYNRLTPTGWRSLKPLIIG
jgi:hypothetical protein